MPNSGLLEENSEFSPPFLFNVGIDLIYVAFETLVAQWEITWEFSLA